MRMQPCDAAVPMDQSCGVPWMPTDGVLRPIHRVPSGLSGPGGTGSAPAAHGEGGGVHVGWYTLLMM